MGRLFITICMLFSTLAHSQEMQWTPFVWYSDTVGGKIRPKLALLLPCTLKGITANLLLQLDSGSDGSVIQEGPCQQYHLPITWADSQHGYTTISGTLGNYRINSMRVLIDNSARDTIAIGDPYPNIGTLGEDFLVGKVLILDFPRNRYSIFDSLNRVPNNFLSSVSFVPLIKRNNKLFISIQLGDTVSSNFFFDTGSSMFQVLTTKTFWRRLTGFQADESSLLRVKASSWGKETVELGAPIRGGVRIGILTVPDVIAYFDSTNVSDFASYPFKTDGLIGNAMFYDEYTVVIDLINDRFGILKE